MLTNRPFERADGPACAELLRELAAYPEADRAALPARWRALLAREACIGTVIEARRGHGPAAIVGFGCAAFVTDAWLEQALEAPRPGLALRTLEASVDGAGPILQPPAIARADAGGGLNVLILHYAEARLADDAAQMDLRYRMLTSFLDSFRGYRLNCVLQELCDEIPHEFIVGGWGRVHSDHADWFAGRGAPLPPPGRRPYLIVLTRAEALADRGNPMASLFVHTPPRFAFSQAEKAMLRPALRGATDRELARLAGVALPTVKSRWRAVYQRVAMVDAALLPDPQDRAVRGPEKRRALLDYLRQHPEELRPGIDERRYGR